jgi:hypothetical protein
MLVDEPKPVINKKQNINIKKNILNTNTTHFYCKKCKKFYISYQSLWKHNKTYHKIIELQNKDEKTFNCKYCNKQFNSKQSKCRHQLHFCKERDDLHNNDDKKDDKKEIEHLKNEVEKLKNNTSNNINTNLINIIDILKKANNLKI